MATTNAQNSSSSVPAVADYQQPQQHADREANCQQQRASRFISKGHMSFKRADSCLSIEADKAATQIIEAAAARWIPIDTLVHAADSNGNGLVEPEELAEFCNSLSLPGESVALLTQEMLNCGLDEPGELRVEEVIEFFHQYENHVSSTSLDRAASCALTTEIEAAKTFGDLEGRFVALVAHNNMKPAMMTFVEKHLHYFSKVKLVTTGSTGSALNSKLGLQISKKVTSGPLGGDQEIGAMVAKNKMAAIFFFKDPLSSHMHSADIEALTRVADVHQVPYATNVSTGNALVYALQQLGMSTQWVEDPRENHDSVLSAYLNGQKKVIEAVSSANDKVAGATYPENASPAISSTSSPKRPKTPPSIAEREQAVAVAAPTHIADRQAW